MPFTEFILSGDVKFIVTYVIFSAVAFYHFFKKVQARKNSESLDAVQKHNKKITVAGGWILTLSGFSLLLGLMHSFYFIGKAGGVAPHLIFQGVSNALITLVFGMVLFMVSRLLKGVYNVQPQKTVA